MSRARLVCRLDYEYYDGDGFSSSPYYHYRHDYYSPPTSPPPPNCSVIATVRGWLTHDSGGRLESVETGVALLVPPRALPPGPAAHLVYFKVCRQDHVRPVDTNGVPLDDGKGILYRTMLLLTNARIHNNSFLKQTNKALLLLLLVFPLTPYLIKLLKMFGILFFIVVWNGLVTASHVASHFLLSVCR